MAEYKVELSALETKTTYKAAVDITEYIDSLPDIIQDVDQGNFEIGVFNYGSLTLNINNSSGKFNSPELDGRSIFPLKRDNAIIEITYIDDAGSETQSFKGLIADRATSQSLDSQAITFAVLSLDSIFDKVIVKTGTIPNGTSLDDAFRIILSDAIIARHITYSESDTNPGVDLTIGDGSFFDNITSKSAIDNLLSASNSVLLIDSNDTIIVRTRAENSNTPHELYLYDQYGRDNILGITGFNNGLQRMFNYITTNGWPVENAASIGEHDEREFQQTYTFVTETVKYAEIGNAILSDFGLPQDELMIHMDIDIAKSMSVFDQVTLNINQYVIPKNNTAPLYEYAEYEVDSYPAEQTELNIKTVGKYKIITFIESPNDFASTIKLRKI